MVFNYTLIVNDYVSNDEDEITPVHLNGHDGQRLMNLLNTLGAVYDMEEEEEYTVYTGEFNTLNLQGLEYLDDIGFNVDLHIEN